MRRYIIPLLSSFLTVFTLSFSASANNCIYRDTEAQVCEGDTVYFWGQADRVIGKVKEVFSSGSLNIRYSKNGYSQDVSLYANEVSASVACKDGICVDSLVSFFFLGSPREGNVLFMFADGMVKIQEQGASSLDAIWMHVSELSIAPTCGDC